MERFIGRNLEDEARAKVNFFAPEALVAFLAEHAPQLSTTEGAVKGYKVCPPSGLIGQIERFA